RYVHVSGVQTCALPIYFVLQPFHLLLITSNKLMLKILLLTKFIILNLSSVIIAQGYWSNVKTHVDVALRNIHFTDSLNGWVCGRSDERRVGKEFRAMGS